MATRPLPARVGWMLRDYAKRVYDNSNDDNVFFLAGGIAFNILLAVVPFVLLLVTGLAQILHTSADASSAEVQALLHRFMPPHAEAPDAPIHRLLDDIIRVPAAVTVYSAIGFVWFSTRLFGSLRGVLAGVFDVEADRGIVEGKIFDIKITIMATLLFVAYSALTTYLEVARKRGVEVLTDFGLRSEVMGVVEYRFGQLLAFLFILMMFYALYKFLLRRRVRWQTALIAAMFSSVMFEVAKSVFATYVASFRPGTIYTGTLYAIVILVSWVYYGALIFILGGEVGQVYELRRVRRMQREVLGEA